MEWCLCVWNGRLLVEWSFVFSWLFDNLNFQVIFETTFLKPFCRGHFRWKVQNVPFVQYQYLYCWLSGRSGGCWATRWRRPCSGSSASTSRFWRCHQANCAKVESAKKEFSFWTCVDFLAFPVSLILTSPYCKTGFSIVRKLWLWWSVLGIWLVWQNSR